MCVCVCVCVCVMMVCLYTFQAAQTTLLNTIGRRSNINRDHSRQHDTSTVSMVTNRQTEQGDGKGFPHSGRHDDLL